jgi:hypothetical protein
MTKLQELRCEVCGIVTSDPTQRDTEELVERPESRTGSLGVESHQLLAQGKVL